MGAVMIRCPETGCSVQTGYEADPARFRTMPVFLARSYCPICRTEHEWFAGDAWVDEHAEYKQQMELDDFLRGRNIARYRQILSELKDATERQTVSKLLKEEIARQKRKPEDERQTLSDRTLLLRGPNRQPPTPYPKQTDQ